MAGRARALRRAFGRPPGALQQPDELRRDPATIAGKVIGYTLVAALAVAVGLVIYGALRHLAGWALG